MGSITIPHFPNKHFSRGCCSAPPVIDLVESVKERLPAGTTLTRDVAIKILKDVSWDSKLKSFFTSPWVLLPSVTALVVTGMFLPPVSMALIITSTVISLIGVMCLGVTFSLVIDGFLGSLSDAYAQQAKETDKMIKQLQSANSNVRVICN